MNDPETTGGPVSFRPGHAARYTTIEESLTCMLPPTTGVQGVSLVGFMVRTATVIAQDTQRRRQIVSLDAHMMFPQIFKPKYEFVKAALKLGIALGGIGLITLMLFLTSVGCTSDAQNIRATNEAAAEPPAVNTPLSAEIGSTEIRDGDCIISKLPEGIDIKSVVIVPCSADWQYRALNSFTVDDFDRYPGEDLLSRRAHIECDRHYTFILFPLADSWALGDRRVNCLQESFGLSGTDPAKLDRLVDHQRLNVGECFDEAPETEHLLVELVSCSGEWQYRALNSFTVDDFDRYQGETLFGQRAYNECDRHFTSTSFPSADTWASGDRRVVCLQEDFGLSGTDPSKLDRLVALHSLNIEECFNEVPETEYALVELVSCSDEWEFQVVDRFLFPLDDAFPGEDHIEATANQECDASFDYYYSPIAESWDLGDRAITCVKSSQ